MVVPLLYKMLPTARWARYRTRRYAAFQTKPRGSEAARGSKQTINNRFPTNVTEPRRDLAHKRRASGIFTLGENLAFNNISQSLFLCLLRLKN